MSAEYEAATEIRDAIDSLNDDHEHLFIRIAEALEAIAAALHRLSPPAA